ncbi:MULTISPECIES: MFS transporter [unclassified Novosphingobium]|uniref:MFS transporter n=2 Tax=Novosphingobium TaxID=165696 RepID=UPI000D447EDB|nr:MULTISPECIES: MFS transporter [unclassified Novosphingobium]PTR10923.1 cyanate permease [Novosphingobium sp. GV055]PUB03473.1 cyanate permease [Novosphingobium sp. GV061]PUB19928.1 cyanate permease [Novosphingobium sp. GV079]PUB41689.1 cyanate permease [Novosphingobium sp. GV027]
MGVAMAGSADAAPGTVAAGSGGPRPALSLAAIGAGTAAAHIGNNFTTFLVGGLIDAYGFTAGAMGLFAMLETLAYGAAMLGVARWGSRLAPRWLALGSTVLVVAAQALSGLGGVLPLLLAGRLATGFGFGVMNGAVNLAAGRTAHPARAISVGIACQTVLFALVNIALPQVAARHGLMAMFGALAGLSLLLGLGTLALPATALPKPAGARAQRPISPAGWRLLLAMGLFAGGSLSIWPFMERAAHAIGLPATTFGWFQSLATITSALGNAALAVAITRLPRRALLGGGLIACALSCALLTTAGIAWVFAVALVVFNASWFIAYPMLLGLAYDQEPDGRLAVMMTATWLLAQSVGALGAGLLADATGSFAGVGLVGFAGCALALGLAMPLARARPHCP